MFKRIFITLALLLPFLMSSRPQAAADGQLQAIEDLGRLNGVALQCKYFQQAQRIKSALIIYLPKERQLGQRFEDATNESFLDSLEDATACPGKDALAARVDAGIKTLKKVFPD